ncbi:hypothetical protein H0H81_005983 [Sphagnurus paluster]|uniref:Uncharacterized protein n=1 Tax=Sphagnurus paluster TaxID=117069 RepID=A0A9P7KJM4_9AGAR|nr:hypothetical protein H0H81_005983 [Sphagnurus paluster]
MPAPHDTYTEQLSVLRKGHPLYYPDPAAGRPPIGIGDVGFIREGKFQFLFSATRAADDPVQVNGVPDGFVPLNLDPQTLDIHERDLEPGPLHSESVVSFAGGAGAQVSTPTLSANASFNFDCNSTRGAILVLETATERTEATRRGIIEPYARIHCLMWYDFALKAGIQVQFGDLMLVTETSKTAAWSIAVYSSTSEQFSLAFSMGNSFGSAGISASGTQAQRLPSVHRRSQIQGDRSNADTLAALPKEHTVFVKGFRLGTRELYTRSLVRTFIRQRESKLGHPITRLNKRIRGALRSGDKSLSRGRGGGTATGPQESTESLKLQGLPDYHPALAVLALEMEHTNKQYVVVHDSEWCKEPANYEVAQEYAKFLFDTELSKKRDIARSGDLRRYAH